MNLICMWVQITSFDLNCTHALHCMGNISSSLCSSLSFSTYDAGLCLLCTIVITFWLLITTVLKEIFALLLHNLLQGVQICSLLMISDFNTSFTSDDHKAGNASYIMNAARGSGLPVPIRLQHDESWEKLHKKLLQQLSHLLHEGRSWCPIFVEWGVVFVLIIPPSPSPALWS